MSRCLSASTGGRAAAGDGRDVYPYPPYSARRRGVLGYGIRARTRVGARPRTTIVPRRTTSQCPPSKGRASSIRVIRSDGVNGEVSDPRVCGICPVFVAAVAAAMLPVCTQFCDALSSGQQFPIAADLFAHPMPIYWRDRLFSKMHYPSSHAGSPIATQQMG